ncbi:MAG: PDZ domain-containing protein [Bacteroidales bacterium]|nr:PDZ domain-containing protein [Bacteroidales bacterium]MBN2763719.1 PDZ domain-containing protein [Bacteroidales bacterium]
MKKTGLLLIVVAFIVFPLNAQLLVEQAFKFGKVLEWIDSYYVDSVNQEKLVETAIIQLLKELDPHSSYLTKEEVDEMNEPLVGNFEGIGISFNILKDTIFIITPISGGPSERVGIMPGDRIIKVDGNNVAGIGITNERVYELLRGKKGTRVSVTILRRNMDELLEFEIIRDKIPIFSIDASYKVDKNTGYIKINRFSLTTIDEFKTALAGLKKDDISNLILDLTGNGGGYLEVAIDLADQFLDKDKLIVYTEGVNNPKKEYFATKEGVFESGRLVVLIDEGSASASEIVSGAIQDWDRGIIIGRRSFGKGLVQRRCPLPDQSEIRLTIARYYTPTGRLIQKPYDMGKDEYDLEIARRYSHGEFISSDSIAFPDSLKYHTLKKKRPVYGGGGIMPDLFVPMDTTYYTDYYRDLIRLGILNRFILNYVDHHRQDLLNRYPQLVDFKSQFKIDDKMMKKLTTYAKEQGLPENSADLAVSQNQIKTLAKGYIARDLWSTSEFYEIINEEDPKFRTALSIIRNWDLYEANLRNRQKMLKP